VFNEQTERTNVVYLLLRRDVKRALFGGIYTSATNACRAAERYMNEVDKDDFVVRYDVHRITPNELPDWSNQIRFGQRLPQPVMSIRRSLDNAQFIYTKHAMHIRHAFPMTGN
jgi:hypothetical protein